MRSFFENKRWIILVSALALGALTVLAVGLGALPFREGSPFGRNDSPDVGTAISQIAEVWISVPLWKQIVVWLLIAVLILLVGLLLSPEMRKRLLLMFIRTALTVWGLYYLLKHHLIPALNINLPANQTAQPGASSNLPVPVFVPPHVSPAFSYILSFIIALLLVAITWSVILGWRKFSALNAGSKPLKDIARIARTSLHDLSSGLDTGNVIVNCYLRMSDVVADTRRLRRDISMTPHEFAIRLEQAGLPGDAVQRLTRLFEGARYGNHKYGSSDVNEAVVCLNSILHYCGEAT